MPLTYRLLVLSLFLLPFARAGSIQQGGPCNQANTHLNPSNKQLTGDCDSTAYCAPNSTCIAKGCRRDEYPFGYSDTARLPPRCPQGEFCPDEEDACQPLLPVGSACQLNRDDECEPPPNAHDLMGSRNENGSVCINFQCMWANVTEHEPCADENTVYTGYYANGDIFYDIVSRDNCIKGTYCDGVSRLCVSYAAVGEACGADKECSSYNCLSSGVCGDPPDAPSVLHSYIYAILGIGIALAITLTFATLFWFHKKNRDRERQRRQEYWNEQDAYRRTIHQMRESARISQSGSGGIYRSLGGGSSRSVGKALERYKDDPVSLSEEYGSPGGSGLRYSFMDDESSGSGDVSDEVPLEGHGQHRRKRSAR